MTQANRDSIELYESAISHIVRIMAAIKDSQLIGDKPYCAHHGRHQGQPTKRFHTLCLVERAAVDIAQHQGSPSSAFKHCQWVTCESI